MAAVEIADRFPTESLYAVAGTLVLRKMSEDEQRYVLEPTRRLLRPVGWLVLADEVRPESCGMIALRWP